MVGSASAGRDRDGRSCQLVQLAGCEDVAVRRSKTRARCGMSVKRATTVLGRPCRWRVSVLAQSCRACHATDRLRASDVTRKGLYAGARHQGRCAIARVPQGPLVDLGFCCAADQRSSSNHTQVPDAVASAPHLEATASTSASPRPATRSGSRPSTGLIDDSFTPRG